MNTLPDYLRPGLRVLFVGINPSIYSAERGHYYARPGNRFWKMLSRSGLVPEPFGPQDDHRLLDHGLGLTDVVKRPTARASEITPEQWQEGVAELRRKLGQFKPRIVCFNSIGAFRKFSAARAKPGLQPERIEAVRIFVLPSSSGLTYGHYSDERLLALWRELARLSAQPSTHPG